MTTSEQLSISCRFLHSVKSSKQAQQRHCAESTSSQLQEAALPRQSAIAASTREATARQTPAFLSWEGALLAAVLCSLATTPSLCPSGC